MKWVLIDVSYLAHRAKWQVDNLSAEDVPTGVLFGFFTQLKSICTHPRVRSNRVALFFDSKRSHRRKQFPEYKRGRRREWDEEERERQDRMKQQLLLLRRDILPSMGVPVYRQTGLESDDLIAYASELLRHDGRGVMVTADGDLYQSIHDRCHWFDPARDKYFDPTIFLSKHGIRPEWWGEVKAIAGCSGDNVPGVPGVGEKTAIQYLTGQLPPRFKKYQAIRGREGRNIIARNRELVVLPHDKTRRFELVPPRYNHSVFFQWCERYEMRSFLKARNEWIQFFGTRRRRRK